RTGTLVTTLVGLAFGAVGRIWTTLPVTLWTRSGAPARGDRDAYREEEVLTEEERMRRELRSVRPQHDDPDIPDDVSASELD
ncbi:hypothetical protein ACC691_40470, partial [Rhizobium johnstonii]|uniref:hypothetical protein n=1 Tax=Rhizobium johnstonii TaxID=3019933 RepID=UPI003F9758A5